MNWGISGIYKIESKIKPERIYIGSSFDVRRRWSSHLSYLRINKHGNDKLQRHYNKYGKEDLVFSLLLGCETGSLLIHEQYFLDALDPYFNVTRTAGSPGAYKHTREHIEKTRKRLLENVKNGWVPWNKGKTGVYSEETLIKMSKATQYRQRQILQYDLEMNLIREWNSANSAAQELSVSQSNIWCCLNGKYNKSYGFIWRYKDIA